MLRPRDENRIYILKLFRGQRYFIFVRKGSNKISPKNTRVTVELI